MQKVISKISVTLLMFVLFSIPFLGMVMSYSAQEIKTMNATIVSFNIPTGKIVFKERKGSNTLALEAGPEIDLKAYENGEEVSVAYEVNGIVKAMSRNLK